MSLPDQTVDEAACNPRMNRSRCYKEDVEASISRHSAISIDTLNGGICLKSRSDNEILGPRNREQESGRDRVKAMWRLHAWAIVMGLALALMPSAAAFQRESLGGWTKASYRPSATRQAIQPTPESCSARLNVLQKNLRRTSLLLESYSEDNANGPGEAGNSGADGDKGKRRWRLGKKEGRRYRSGGGRGFAPLGGANATTAVMDAPQEISSAPSDREVEMVKRMTQLEALVAKQTVEIRRLQEECRKLTEVSETFANVVELLREAGLQTDEQDDSSVTDSTESSLDETTTDKGQELDFGDFIDGTGTINDAENMERNDMIYEYFDDSEIFGEAPSSVTDAADAAGAAILAGLLGGKKRMLVDVRDSELSRDPETLVQFIELAILPVASGLEGLLSNRNRVKIVFPTVSQLLEYRRTMALAAPEVVALSTLGFDPVEERDNIVIIVAPPPNDEEGVKAMNELLNPSPWNRNAPISQPVVVLNHHMVPLSGPALDYDVMYHLRLLSVQYMSGERADSLFQPFEDSKNAEDDFGLPDGGEQNTTEARGKKPDDELLEAAMKHAHEAGVNHGTTRAMVIRAYPKPWHVFVDVSPDTDADFVVADTFNDEPSSDQVNNAIVECLEGSAREDEIVAQQMQQALEMKSGNLDIATSDKTEISNIDHSETSEGNDEDEDEFDDWHDLWDEDSV